MPSKTDTTDTRREAQDAKPADRWLEFGDNVLIKAAEVSYADQNGRVLLIVVSGVARALTSSTEEDARTRYELIRSEMGFA